jgi:glycine/D-amino acid oxidase-like deaminating enzyme
MHVTHRNLRAGDKRPRQRLGQPRVVERGVHFVGCIESKHAANCRSRSVTRRVLVAGGGVIGAATAFFLAARHGLRATVLERDPSYRRASSALSASSIRQQFSTAVNIRLSQASLDFYRRIGDELAVGGQRPDIALVERGYLFLATAAGAAILRANHETQRACGVDAATSPAPASARAARAGSTATACCRRSAARPSRSAPRSSPPRRRASTAPVGGSRTRAAPTAAASIATCC